LSVQAQICNPREADREAVVDVVVDVEVEVREVAWVARVRTI